MVERFSNEIVVVRDQYIALPTIVSIGSVYKDGLCGFGSVNYCFIIRSAFGEKVVAKIYGDEIEYYKLQGSEQYNEDNPAYTKRKAELECVRQELIRVWADYLDEKTNKPL